MNVAVSSKASFQTCRGGNVHVYLQYVMNTGLNYIYSPANSHIMV